MVPAHAVQWGVSDAVAVIAAAHVLALFWVSLMLAAGVVESGDTPLSIIGLILGNLGLWAGYLGGPVVVASRKGRGAVSDYGASIELMDIPFGLIVGVVAQVALLPLLYVPIGWFIDGDPSAPGRELIEAVDGPLDALLLTLSAAVLAPLLEELIYRGLFLRALLRRMGAAPAVTISALVFAAVHLEPLLIPGLFLFGVLSAGLALRSGRLGPAWAMHVGFNVAGLVGLGIS